MAPGRGLDQFGHQRELQLAVERMKVQIQTLDHDTFQMPGQDDGEMTPEEEVARRSKKRALMKSDLDQLGVNQRLADLQEMTDQVAEEGVEYESEGSSDQDFLNFQDSELQQMGHSTFQLQFSKNFINQCFANLNSAARVQAATSVQEWFEKAVPKTVKTNDFLDQKEQAFIPEVREVDHGMWTVQNMLEKRPGRAVQVMSQFHRQVLALHERFPLDSSDSSSEDRFPRRKKPAATAGGASVQHEAKDDEDDDEDSDGSEVADLSLREDKPGQKAWRERRKGRRKIKRRSRKSGDMTDTETGEPGGKRRSNENEENGEPNSKVDESKKGADGGKPVKPTASSKKRKQKKQNDKNLGSNLLDLISKQQDELTQLKASSDMAAKRLDTLKGVLEFTRAVMLLEEAGHAARGSAAALAAGSASARKAGNRRVSGVPVMTEASKELFVEMQDSNRVQYLQGLLESEEGKVRLARSAAEHKNPHLEAMMKTFMQAQDMARLQADVRRLDKHLAAANSGRNQVEELKNILSAVREATFREKERAGLAKKRKQEAMAAKEAANWRTKVTGAAWVLEAPPEVHQILEMAQRTTEVLVKELQEGLNMFRESLNAAKTRAVEEVRQREEEMAALDLNEETMAEFKEDLKDVDDKYRKLCAEADELDNDEKKLKIALKSCRETTKRQSTLASESTKEAVTKVIRSKSFKNKGGSKEKARTPKKGRKMLEATTTFFDIEEGLSDNSAQSSKETTTQIEPEVSEVKKWERTLMEVKREIDDLTTSVESMALELGLSREPVQMPSSPQSKAQSGLKAVKRGIGALRAAGLLAAAALRAPRFGVVAATSCRALKEGEEVPADTEPVLAIVVMRDKGTPPKDEAAPGKARVRLESMSDSAGVLGAVVAVHPPSSPLGSSLGGGGKSPRKKKAPSRIDFASVDDIVGANPSPKATSLGQSLKSAMLTPKAVESFRVQQEAAISSPTSSGAATNGRPSIKPLPPGVVQHEVEATPLEGGSPSPKSMRSRKSFGAEVSRKSRASFSLEDSVPEFPDEDMDDSPEASGGVGPDGKAKSSGPDDIDDADDKHDDEGGTENFGVQSSSSSSQRRPKPPLGEIERDIFDGRQTPKTEVLDPEGVPEVPEQHADPGVCFAFKATEQAPDYTLVPLPKDPPTLGKTKWLSRDKMPPGVLELLNLAAQNAEVLEQMTLMDEKIRGAKRGEHNVITKDSRLSRARSTILSTTSVGDEVQDGGGDLAETNKILRREVVRKQRDLNNLRTRWWDEKAKASHGADVPSLGQVEAALIALLRDGSLPTLSETLGELAGFDFPEQLTDEQGPTSTFVVAVPPDPFVRDTTGIAPHGTGSHESTESQGPDHHQLPENIQVESRDPNHLGIRPVNNAHAGHAGQQHHASHQLHGSHGTQSLRRGNALSSSQKLAQSRMASKGERKKTEEVNLEQMHLEGHSAAAGRTQHSAPPPPPPLPHKPNMFQSEEDRVHPQAAEASPKKDANAQKSYLSEEQPPELANKHLANHGLVLALGRGKAGFVKSLEAQSRSRRSRRLSSIGDIGRYAGTLESLLGGGDDSGDQSAEASGEEPKPGPSTKPRTKTR